MENRYKVKVTYLFNSGFVVETRRHLLVFDFYREAADRPARKILRETDLPEFLQTDQMVYIFASHHHADHYNPAILSWEKFRTGLTYILSDDINLREKPKRYHLVAADRQLEIDTLQLKTIGSTDQGVAFLVKVDELSIFHAGDLNWWYWWDDRPAEIAEMERRFKGEIAKISGEHVDLAFFPVDPRLAGYFHYGGRYFMEKVQPGIFFPMHFGLDYEIIERFAYEVRDLPSAVMKIKESPEKFNSFE